MIQNKMSMLYTSR